MRKLITYLMAAGLVYFAYNSYRKARKKEQDPKVVKK